MHGHLHVRTEQGKLNLFVAIDRSSKFVLAELPKARNAKMPAHSSSGIKTVADNGPIREKWAISLHPPSRTDVQVLLLAFHQALGEIRV